MTQPYIPPDLKPIIDFHGHFCPGLVLGYREGVQSIFVVTCEEQIRILREKECGCKV